MKRIALFFAALVVGLLLAGCATCPPPDYSADPKLAEAWQKYRAIDPDHFTPEQAQMAKEFDKLTKGKISDAGRKRIATFPWLRADDLSMEDKVFLIQTAKEAIEDFKAMGGVTFSFP